MYIKSVGAVKYGDCMGLLKVPVVCVCLILIQIYVSSNGTKCSEC